MAPVIFLGGNGHCGARLASVQGIEIYDVPYSGFEGRPRARSLDEFLDSSPTTSTPSRRP